tara:strand:- start:1173 stop:1601 length:429 start_codon:yes stop_codon:yes gene_type:complete
MKKNYMKYWRVVKYFVRDKYGITTADLEMLLFLYDEPYFTKAKFTEFNKVFSWDRQRFKRLVTNGWVETIRTESKSRLSVYDLTYKAKRAINLIYEILEGREIGQDKGDMFKSAAGYNDKVYRNMIEEMNEFTRQRRRQAQK